MKYIKYIENIDFDDDKNWYEIQDEQILKIGDMVRSKNGEVYYWYQNKIIYKDYSIKRRIINIKKPDGEFENKTDYVVELENCVEDLWFRIEDLEKI